MRSQTRRSPSSTSTSSESTFLSDNLHRGCLLHSSLRLVSPTPSAPPPQTHTTHFSFNINLIRPCVTTSITVVFHEEPQDNVPISAPMDYNISKAQDAVQGDGLKDLDNEHLQGQVIMAT